MKLERLLFENYTNNFFEFFFIFKSSYSPASGYENIRFPDSPDFEKFPDFRTERDVQ